MKHLKTYEQVNLEEIEPGDYVRTIKKLADEPNIIFTDNPEYGGIDFYDIPIGDVCEVIFIDERGENVTNGHSLEIEPLRLQKSIKNAPKGQWAQSFWVRSDQVEKLSEEETKMYKDARKYNI